MLRSLERRKTEPPSTPNLMRARSTLHATFFSGKVRLGTPACPFKCCCHFPAASGGGCRPTEHHTPSPLKLCVRAIRNCQLCGHGASIIAWHQQRLGICPCHTVLSHSLGDHPFEQHSMHLVSACTTCRCRGNWACLSGNRFFLDMLGESPESHLNSMIWKALLARHKNVWLADYALMWNGDSNF